MARDAAKIPNAEQCRILEAHGIDPRYKEIVKDYTYSMIVRDLYTGEQEVVEK